MTDRAKLAVLMADRGVRLVVAVANVALLARALGPRDYGHYAAGLVFVALIDSVASLGLPSVLPARLAVRESGRARWLVATLLLRSGGLLLCLVGVAAWEWSRGGMQALRDPRVVVVGALLVTHWSVGDAFLQGIGAPQRGAAIKSATALLFLAVRALLVAWWHPTILDFVWVYLGEQGALSLATLLACKRAIPSSLGSVDAPWPWLELLRYALAAWGSQIAILVYMRVDQLILARLAPPESLANYALAVQVVEMTYTIPIVANAITIRRLGTLRRTSVAAFDLAMTRVYRAAFLCAVLCAAAIAAGAPLFVRTFFGNEYAPAAGIMAILALSVPFVTLGSIQVAAIFTGAKPSTYLRKTLLAALLSPPLALVGWYAAGTPGLAWATVFVQAFASFLVNRWLDRDSFRQQVEAIRGIGSGMPIHPSERP